MKQSLDIKLNQGLVMTAELRQAINILAMPVQDLTTFVGNELLENPFLQAEDGIGEGDVAAVTDLAASERDSADAMDEKDYGDELPLDYGWDNLYDVGSDTVGSGSVGASSSFSGADESVWEKTASEAETLHDHLVEQLHLAVKSHTDLFLGQYLIEAIDDSGYLRLDLSDAAKRLQVDKERLEDMLAVVQTFEPTGVGARDLSECLRLQLHAADNLTDVADVVVRNLPLLAKQDYEKLAKMAKANKMAILETVEDIALCNPKPGLEYGSNVAEAVLPDVIVFDSENGWQVELNAEAMPKVLLNKTAQDIFGGTDKDTKNYINERVGRANWLVKSLEQRARTILKVSRAIVKEQADFFVYGVESLKPMTLKQIADLVDVHESTVSRVTNGKFMQTPLGMFELKHFFSAGIGTTGGQVEVAASSVKAMIKRLVDEEDSRKPLSDEKLVKLLKDEGVDVARRTVAKYREAQGIPSSSGRRIR
ncbi:MAG: RNA polymerase factor sigma-54 [Alphaproteobacteria bacterium]|nr:RNA polymerase factor sigma-54 [Alphaproteobacteria bacterium]MDD9919404.1 RNA polymerase factor sigma-54 [Alphaproteobacteria bacterium]